MTNPKKAFLTTLLLVVLIAPSAGCGAVRAAGGAAKFFSHVGKGKGAVKVITDAPKVIKHADAAKAFKGVDATRTASAARDLGAGRILQTQPTRLPMNVGTFNNSVPDEIAEVCLAAPDSETAFIMSYKRPPTPSELENITKFQSSSGAQGTDRFAAYLSASRAKNIILIGHNHKGNFYFSNGESMPIEAMARLINAHNKRGIFLSCEANKYVPRGYPASTTNLTHETALKIADNLSRNLKNDALRFGNPADELAVIGEDSQLLGEAHAADNLLSLREQRISELIQTTVNSGERRAQVRHTVQQVGKLGAPGGGTGYFMIRLKARGEARKRNRQPVSPLSLPLRG